MNMTNRSVAVRIEGIRKQFPTQLALDGVDLTVEPGSFTTLLGPSGCGKTTLLRIIAGFETATNGRVLFDGKDVISTPVWRRNIGFVFQNYALWPHMSVHENIAYGLNLKKLSKQAVAERVHESLSMVGLDGRAEAFPGQLSGGQQQRVAIARALALRPTVLLLDEPLSNLDAKMRVGMRRELLRIQREVGITAIYVTHDQEEALEMSDQVAVINAGRVDQAGSPQEVYNRPESAYVASFVGHVTLLRGTSDETGMHPDVNLVHDFPAPKGKLISGRVQFVLRPEHLSIVEPEEGHLVGQLERASYFGNGYRSGVRLSDGTRCLVAHRDMVTAEPGSTVGVRVHSLTLVPESDDYFRDAEAEDTVVASDEEESLIAVT